MDELTKRMNEHQRELYNKVLAGLGIHYDYDLYDHEYHDALRELVMSVMDRQTVALFEEE